MTVNNALIDLLHSQQQTQNDNSHTMAAIQEAQLMHPNDSLIDDIPPFDGTPL